MSATELLFTDQWHAIPLADLEEGSREKNVEVRKASRASNTSESATEYTYKHYFLWQAIQVQ